jgi:hypothetical protein
MYEVRSDIGFCCLYGNVTEMNIPGMSHKETLGWQTAPHGRFRIIFLFLILDRPLYLWQITGLYSSFMMDVDV